MNLFHTGAIRTIAPLDHEVISEIEFSVSVRDGGTPTLMSPITAKVKIRVKDINDVPPRFMQQEYNATVLVPTYK